MEAFLVRARILIGIILIGIMRIGMRIGMRMQALPQACRSSRRRCCCRPAAAAAEPTVPKG